MISHGLAGSVFVDYGPRHTVYQLDISTKQIPVCSITNSNPAIVTVDSVHCLSVQDHVQFTGVEGMTEINRTILEVSKIISNETFKVKHDTSNYPSHSRGGWIQEVTKPFTVHFSSLSETLTKQVPSKIIPANYSYPKAHEQMHLITRTLMEFNRIQGHLPKLLDANDAEEQLEISLKVNGQFRMVTEVNNDLVRKSSMYCRTQISPCASFFGGIVGQEIFKFMGRAHPLHQLFYYEVYDLVENLQQKNDIQNLPSSLYDNNLIIFGKKFQQALGSIKCFMIGAGALGCEYVKMLSLLGLGTDEYNGELCITNDDHIEISNLNRQFFFSTEDFPAKAHLVGEAGK